jgi:hypothetical protein
MKERTTMRSQHPSITRRIGQRVVPFTLFLLAGGACKPMPADAPEEAQPKAAGATATEPPPAPSPQDIEEQAARGRARAWLALVDQGQYTASWDAAAPLFQSSTTKEQWQGAAQGARTPLGGLSKRELRAVENKKSLPGAPAGEYMVVHFDSAFAKKAPAREVVTLILTPDDSWKVVGYFVE